MCVALVVLSSLMSSSFSVLHTSPCTSNAIGVVFVAGLAVAGLVASLSTAAYSRHLNQRSEEDIREEVLKMVQKHLKVCDRVGVRCGLEWRAEVGVWRVEEDRILEVKGAYS